MKRYLSSISLLLSSLQWTWKLFTPVATLFIFLLLGPTTVSADPPTPLPIPTARPSFGVNGGLDPNYVFTAKEIQRMKERDELARQHYSRKLLEKHLEIAPLPNSLGGKTLAVGYWPEPNDMEHVNYCGPAATQVALDARLPWWQVPDLETLAAEENLDPNWSVYMTNLCPVLYDESLSSIECSPWDKSLWSFERQ